MQLLSENCNIFPLSDELSVKLTPFLGGVIGTLMVLKMPDVVVWARDPEDDTPVPLFPHGREEMARVKMLLTQFLLDAAAAKPLSGKDWKWVRKQPIGPIEVTRASLRNDNRFGCLLGIAYVEGIGRIRVREGFEGSQLTSYPDEYLSLVITDAENDALDNRMIAIRTIAEASAPPTNTTH